MMNDVANIWCWLGFSIFIIIALGVDTFYLSKRGSTQVSLRAALFWSIAWIVCALIFYKLLWFYLYKTVNTHIANEVSLDFLTGYLIEKSLSIDNLFAFYLVFSQLRIPPIYQRTIFAYGVWSAIVMRLGLIWLGAWLVADFHWLLYLMGAFLLLTGIKMLVVSHAESDIYQGRIFRWLKTHLRVTQEIKGNKFFIKKDKFLYATPLLIALIFIEISDLIFAFDSIPAIFAITTDPFIVWTSNIFAILGLRALYFLLSGMIDRLHLLKYGIALILVFVGLKMVIQPWYHIPVEFSLLIILAILLLFSGLSLFKPKH